MSRRRKPKPPEPVGVDELKDAILRMIVEKFDGRPLTWDVATKLDLWGTVGWARLRPLDGGAAAAIIGLGCAVLRRRFSRGRKSLFDR
jgi:hypothetical protein